MVGTRVYVGGLPYGVRQKDLERFFKGYGRIREILLKNGYGFCEFDDYRDADDAVYELNGKELLGERVIVEHARGTARGEPRLYGGGMGGYTRRRSSWMDKDMDVYYHDRYGPPTRTEYRLIVENLSSRISWQDLKDFMRQAGEVTYADAHKQRRNEGVVEFASYSDMRNALQKLDDTELNGRRIRLIEDTHSSRGRRSRSSSSRSRSPSRSRSRRRSRTRSRSRSRGSRSRSHSKSKSVGRYKSPSRSKSRSRSKSKSRSKSRSRSKSEERFDVKAKSRSPSSSGSRSETRQRSKSRSLSRPEMEEMDGESGEKSPSRSPSRDGSKSPKSTRGSESPKRSGSESPDEKADDE
ncbi:serine-arginine protein 55-like isoform X3 [Schistocerca americana]|uniref:serine-arginine protein 55-like isoform X3 n=1 Tax=Schistocerca americana TaxID=7009 RepID=UPI001F4F3FD4|nr:serine-arginine protein 55-like isoform X3 [Schistocerca americana]XP_047104366.1 serine-arginine protein 55-like isoform X3 [Schistocerca piceifrons]XP_049784025.1 serine-arginine protein 55-like isoform X3 [Schistocerca cancellata]XP_049844872.1 serine-arginine protein 55-like isoform X3 [Schistocerca gregaria]XP_049952705.1 serine-arginine protein 55-like isoform X3 [Schistocerca serialis cubense]